MDMFDGFVFLEEKKKSLIPILCQYDFLSALTAAFSITSWRKCPFLPIMDTTQKALQSIHTWLSTKCFRRITNMYSSR